MSQLVQGTVKGGLYTKNWAHATNNHSEIKLLTFSWIEQGPWHFQWAVH